MKKVVEFPDRSTVAEEAAEWLVRLDGDEAPCPETLEGLRRWMQRSAAHRAELEKLATLWQRLNVLTDLAVPLGRPARAEEPAQRHRTGGSRFRRHPALVSVSILLLVGCTFALLQLVPLQDRPESTNGLYATAVGQQSSTVLADGSEIALNTNSQIRVDYSDAYRRVHLLQGEALFTVAKDAKRPFRVYAGSGRIQALGTAFSIYMNGDDISVIVAEGRVSLASIDRAPRRPPAANPRDDQEAARGGMGPPEEEYLQTIGTIEAGYAATLRASPPEPASGSAADLEIIQPVAPEELAQRLAWRDGVLMFSGDTLEDVVREVSRYTTVRIEVPDADVRNMRIGGRLPVGETAAMLTALETNFSLKVTRLDRNRVLLTAANE